MAKQENNQEIYINEDEKSTSKFRTWISSRPAKITAISIGGVLALGFAFTGGALAGSQLLGDHDGPGFANSFDRDGDHESKFDGDHSPRSEHGPDADEVRGGKFQFDGSQPVNPDSATDPSITTP